MYQADTNGLNSQKYILLDFEFGVTDKSSSFLDKFPFGKVPAVELR